MEGDHQSHSLVINIAEEQNPYGNPVCCEFLYAAWVGDENTIDRILQQNGKTIITTPITPTGETVLQIMAVDAQEKHVFAIQKLLEHMAPDDLEIANNFGTIALHFAASSGNKGVADLMLNINPMLATIANNGNVTPLYMAAFSGHKDMVEYLLPLSGLGDDNSVYGSTILNVCIDSGLYGIALQLIRDFPSFAVNKDFEKKTALEVLAQKPSAFDSRADFKKRHNLLHLIISFPYGTFLKQVTHQESSHSQPVFKLLQHIWEETEQRTKSNLFTIDRDYLLFEAAYNDNYEFIVDLLKRHPDLIYRVNSANHTIFHIAIQHRCEPIFSLIYELGPLKDFIAEFKEDDTNNTMLHLVARLAPRDQLTLLPGAALQLQRELLWYKEVEKVVNPSYRQMKNKEGKTPHDIFTKEHETLMKEGEKWMKKTAEFCMVVSTLIATVIFAAVFTVPGGINDNNGLPVFVGKRLFSIFMMSEIVSMLSACTSIIMFLSILTSRYAEQDFIEALPFWLITGTTSLFISLTSMMVAFSTAFLMFGKHGIADVPAFVGLVVFVPLMFVWLKYPLLVDIISSTYGSRFLFRSRGRLFCM
ncbi:hypothetical protein Leryth_013590 [Lithospermum erythrorhizon]|nr:hypothetical protein Leryth_013590 [Lithospermum erythrorhizon]